MNAQTLQFSNGVKLSHSIASRKTEKFCKDVANGKITIKGLTAIFSNSEITIRGLSKKSTSTLRILKGI